jgi:hypothetical protein
MKNKPASAGTTKTGRMTPPGTLSGMEIIPCVEI